MPVKITTLSDNSATFGYLAEWGLSILIVVLSGCAGGNGSAIDLCQGWILQDDVTNARDLGVMSCNRRAGWPAERFSGAGNCPHSATAAAGNFRRSASRP